MSQDLGQVSAGDNVIDDSFFASNILLDDFKPIDLDVENVFNEHGMGNSNFGNNGNGGNSSGVMDLDSKLEDIGDTLRKDWLSSMGSGPGFD